MGTIGPLTPVGGAPENKGVPQQKEHGLETTIQQVAVRAIGSSESTGTVKEVITAKGNIPPADPNLANNTQETAMKMVKAVTENSKTSPDSSIPKVTVQSKCLGVCEQDIEALGSEKLYEMINDRRKEIKQMKEEYRQKFEGSTDKQMQSNVQELMKVGILKPVDGGKSGVYFLCTNDGKPKYVLKPIDEEALVLNNPKKCALPFADSEGKFRTKVGIPLYQSLQNTVIGYEMAQIIGVERATPRCIGMILESPEFSDITDGVTEDREKLLQLGGNPDKEKLCVVQEFIPGCEELGTIILSNSKLSQQELMNLNEAESQKMSLKATPDDIDHTRFEEAAILTWVIGEKDGNAGNFIVSKESDSNTKLRNIFKIDCAASSPESNVNLTTGLCWSIHNYNKPFSESTLKLISAIDVNKLAEVMTLYGKSDEAVEAMKKRVEFVQDIPSMFKDDDIKDIDYYYQTSLEP